MHKRDYKKGVETRFIIHQILYAIKYKNSNFEELFELSKKNKNLNIADLKLINDVVLNSMRLFLYVNKIINTYTKKKPKKNQYILLLSSITQLVFLNYKNYAVINCAVEIAKIKKVNAIPSFINGVLKKIDLDKTQLKKISLDKNSINNYSNSHLLKDIDYDKKIKLLNTISQKPEIHAVFKNIINNNDYKFLIKKSSNFSGVIKLNESLLKNEEFRNGLFWIQDFSAMLPIYLTKNLNNLKILDLCSAPGGKTFQLIQKGANVSSVEINPKRAKILKNNLERLGLDSKIEIIDALKLKEDKKYDVVVIDAPCSSIGTMRRNPDILFKENFFDIKKLLNLQKKLLIKADKFLNKDGLIIYIVCSFLSDETSNQIYNFLKNYKNYNIERFVKDKNLAELIDSNGFVNILPRQFNNFLIDGFFAAKLKKYD